MLRPRMLIAGSACVLLGLLTPGAGATTRGKAEATTLARAIVVGTPTLSATSAWVPVLLSEGTRARLRQSDPVIRIRVPRARGIRARAGVIAPGGLRIGDRVSAALGPVRAGVARTAIMRVTTRGGVASFDRLKRSRTRALQQAAGARDEVAKLDASGSGVQGAPAGSSVELRAHLEQLRHDLNVLVADLRATEGQITDAIARIERERPAAPARRDATARRQRPVIDALRASRDEAARARLALEAAVTRLDAALLDVGGTSDPALPVGTVGTVTDVVQAVLAIVGEVQPPPAG